MSLCDVGCFRFLGFGCFSIVVVGLRVWVALLFPAVFGLLWYSWIAFCFLVWCEVAYEFWFVGYLEMFVLCLLWVLGLFIIGVLRIFLFWWICL